jgi:hypothetical protein
LTKKNNLIIENFKMQLKRIFGAAVMSFFLGLLFYMVAAAIMESLPALALSANIRGRDIDIILDIIRPFSGNSPPENMWNPQDTMILIIVWGLGGLIGGFVAKNELEGAISTVFAFLIAFTLSFFASTPIIGTDPTTDNFIEIIIYRMNFFITEELLRMLLFVVIAFISGYYFGRLSRIDVQKVQQFWTRLNDNSNKIQLPFECPYCKTTFESNPLYCSSCGKKVREEVKTPTF